MKKKLLLLPFVGLLIYVVLSGNASGPGATSGVDATTAGCSCHNATASTTTTVSLQLLSSGVPVSYYTPGGSYTIRLTGTQTSGSLTLPRFGFQVSATNSGGSTTGTLTAPTGTHTVSPSGVTIVEHSSPVVATTGTGGAGSTYVMDIPWTAPSSGTGTVTLRGVVNTVNYNGSADGGDQWKNTSVTVVEGPILNTIAGTGTAGSGGDGSAATSAQVNNVYGIVTDAAGNIYFAEYNGNKVRKINTAGIVSTFAGTGTAGSTGDGTAATSATLNHPIGVAVDASGNVYISEYSGGRVRKVNTSGIISTFVTGLSNPTGLCVDASNNLYIAAQLNYQVMKVTPAGSMTTYAGTGAAGFSGDGSAATLANLNSVTGVAMDASGNLYISMWDDQHVRKVSPSGIITTVAGTGTPGFSGDGSAATSAQIYQPYSVAVDAAGNLYIADVSNFRVRKVNTSTGIITTIAGTGTSTYNGTGLPATSTNINGNHVFVDAYGNLLISDQSNYRIRIMPASLLTANTGTMSLCIGATTTLSNSTSGGTWITANAAVATVGSSTGIVTGVTAGTAKITYATNGGSAISIVTVNSNPSAIAGILNTVVGGTSSLSSTPAGGTWVSGNTSIATVGSSSGVLSGVTTGTALITYTSVCSITAIATVSVPPVITSVSPNIGFPGSSVTITGSNFNSTAANNIVYFGSTKASVTSASGSSVTVNVPTGSIYSPVSVLNTAASRAAYSPYPFLPTYDNSSYTQGVIQFNSKVDYSASGSERSVAIGDIDGDGKADVVTVNNTTNSISVYRNASTSGAITTSSLSARTDFTAGTAPEYVTLADFDGDGKLDIAVSNNTAGTVSVFRNTATSGSISSGSLAAKVDFTTASGPHCITAGDLDEDGKPEIIVASTSGISIFPNTTGTGAFTTGSFGTRVDIASTGGYGIALNDMDGDGKRDLVMSGGSAAITVFRNIYTTGVVSSSSFASGVSFTTANGPHQIATGDIDGDGKQDVVVQCWYPTTVFSVLRNTSTSGSITSGSFAAKVDITFPGNSAEGVALGDFDGDTKPDVALVYNYSGGAISIYRNAASTGSITAASFQSPISFNLDPVLGVAIGDIDGDGKADIVTSNNGSTPTNSIIRNNQLPAPPVITSVTPGIAVPGNTVTITGDKFNTTAANNIVYFGATKASVSAATTNSLTVTVPIGATFQPVSVFNSGLALSGTSNNRFLSDYDNSNYLDSINFNSKVDFATGTSPAQMAIGDLDGDGKADLVISNDQSSTISVFRNTSSTGAITASSFTTKVDFTVGATPSGVAIGDIDGDGKPDIAVANNGSSFYSVFRNISSPGSITSGSFSSRVDFSEVSNLSSIELVDMDGDGKRDVMMTEIAGNHLDFCRNVASPGAITTTSIQNGAMFSLGTYPRDMTYADIDGDGKKDIITCNYSANTISILRNSTMTGYSIPGLSGGSPFATKVDFATGSGPGSIAAADIDGDGKEDIIVANTLSNTVSVFRNVASSGTINSSSLSTRVDFTAGARPGEITVADMNGDGKPDVIFTNTNDSTISVMKNNATSGSISTTSLLPKRDFSTTRRPIFVGVGDFDGDKKPDAAILLSSNNVAIMRNNPMSLIAGTTTVCIGTVTTLTDTATGGTWSSSNTAVATVGSSSGIVTTVGVGSATITFTTPGGITTTTYVVNPLPAAIAGSTSLCVGSTTSLSCATPAATWSSSIPSVASVGSASGVATGIFVGTATISYTLSTGCSSTVIVTVNASPAAITGTTSLCEGATTSLATTSTGGTWSSSNPAVASVTSGGVVSGNVAGIATITYSFSSGCNATTTVTVYAVPAAISGTLAFCTGTTTSLSSSTAGGTWNSSNTAVASISSSTGVATGVAAGTATITYTLASGCFSTAVVTVSPLPAAITGTMIVCEGGTTSLSSATSGGTWSSGSPTTAIVGIFTGVVSGMSFGTATISYRLGTGCVTTATVTVNPVPGAITGTLAFCDGSSTSLSDVTAGGVWSSSYTAIAPISSSTGVATGVSAGTTTITYTLATGCYTTAVATVYALPGAITGTAVVCVGGTTSLGNSTSGGTWSTSDAVVATVNSVGVVSGVGAGTTFITYTITGGCYTVRTVTVNAGVSAITGGGTVCAGGTLSLSDATSGGVWSSSNSSVATVGATTGMVSAIIGGTTTISYNLSGCLATTVVTVNSSAAVFSITGGGMYCSGGSGVNIGLSGSQTGISYQLYLGATPVGSAMAGTGTALSFGLQTTAGTYSVQATNTSTTCTRDMSGSANVAITTSPSAITGTFSVCIGVATTLSDSTTGGTWLSSTTAIAYVGSATGIITGNAAGTASITYTLSTGCFTTQVITVNVTPGAGTITGPTSVLIGSNITLSDAAPGWASNTPMPVVRHSPEAIATMGNNIYFFGGGDASGQTNTTLIYNISTNSWSTGATMPDYRYAGDGAGVINNKIYVPGGWTSSPGLPHNTLFIYNLTTNSWTTGATMPALSAQGITGVINNKLYVTSAANGFSGYVRSLYLYDTSSGWSSLANSPIAHESPGGGVINGKLYVVGGYNDAGTAITSQLDVYDPSSNTWTTKTSAPAPIHGPASAVLNGKLYLAGNNDGSTIQNVVYVYDPVSDTWATQTSLPVPMQVAGGIGVNGNMYVMGGLNSSVLNSNYVFTPSSWSSSTPSVASVNQSGVVTGIGSGTATISYTVTSGTSGCNTSATYTITSGISPITGTMVVCAGSTVTLTDSTSGGTWSSGNTAVATVGSSSGIVTGVAGGTATISYTVAGSTVTAVITVNAAPSAGTITGASSVCAGSVITLSDAVSGGSWFSGTSSVATVDGAGVVTGITAGTATISYMVFGACGSATATKAITVNALPGAGTISGATSVCVSSAIALSTSGSGGSWSSSASAVASVNASGVVSGLTPGAAIISYSVTNGCGTAVDTQMVTINALPNAGTITGASSVCAGSTISLTDGVSGGSWTSSMPSVATVDGSGVVTGSIAGTVTISYTVFTACGSATATKTITVNAVADAGAISGAASVCVSSAITLSTSGSGGSWSSSTPSVASVSTSGVVSGIVAGTAIISYSVSNSCGTSVDTQMVSVNPLPNAGTITGASSVCAGSTISLTDGVSGGSWTSGMPSVATVDGSGVVTGSIAGTVAISYTVFGACGSATATKVITVNALPNAGTITGATSVCVSSTNSLSTSGSGGSWSSSAPAFASVNTSGVVNGIAAGTSIISYSVTNGCGTAVDTQIVTISPLPGAGTISGASSVCVGSTITLSDGVSGGSWSSGSPTIASVNSAGVVSGLAAAGATITYTVTNSCGASVATKSITVSPNPSAGTLSGPTSVCVGAAISLSSTISGGSWTSGSPTVASVGTAGIVNGLAGGVATISYTVTNGCGTATGTKTVTVNPLPDAGSITGASSVCVSANTTLSNTASGGAWSSNNTLRATVNATSGVVSGVSAGTVTISYTVTNTCGTAIATSVLTVNPAPNAGTITGASSVCVGSATSLSDAVSGGSWFSSMPSVATIDASGVVTGSIAGGATISYMVTNSCGTATVTKAITVNALPNAGTITGSSAVNVGSTITLTNTAGGGSWSASNSAATVSSGGVVTGVSAGTVIISYTVTNSCGTATDTMAITVNAIPLPITGTRTVCAGLTTTLSNGNAGGSWYSSNTSVASIDVASGVVTGLSAGTSTISYVHAVGTVTAVVTVNATPAAISGTAIVCAGSTTNLSTTPAGGAWSSSATGVATITTAGVATGVAAGTTTISYTLSTGCANSLVLTINASPSVSGTLALCTGGSASLTGSPAGGTWVSSNAAVASVDSTGVISGLTVGTSVISYTGANGCRATRIATVSTTPTVGAISGSSTVTVGSTITLTNSISGGTWSTSSGNATISASGVVTGVAAGTTVVSYVKSNSCGTATATAIVTVNGAPITGTAVVCAGSSTSLSHIVSGGTWSSGNTAIATVGSTTGVVTGVSAGTADITYTYSTGSAIRTVTVNAAPGVGSITGTTSICSGATSTLGNSTAGGSWTSSTTSVASVVSSTGVVTGLAAGTARVTYTVSNSCGTANAITTVTVTSSPSAGTITGTATLCVGGTTTLSSSGSGGLWSSGNTAVATIGSSINIVNGISAGTATISYVVTNSCGASTATKVVTVNGAPSAGSITGTATVCIGSTRTLSATVSGGVWLSGDVSLATVGSSNGVVAGVSAGIVTISYGVSGSCGTTFATRAVTVNAAPGVSPISGTLTLCATGTTTLSDATSGGTWTSGATGIATVNSTTGVVTGVTVGTATISYTANTTCGTAIATAVVTVSTMSGGVISGSATVCAGATTTFGHPVSGGNWSSSNTAIASVDVTSGIVSGIAVGSATISYTTVGACGTAIATKGITVNTVPSPGTITGSASTCVGSSVTLSDAVTGGVWLSADASIATISSSSGILSGISGGAVAISYAVSNSCGTSFATRIETVNPAPSVGTISGPSTACTGTTITLTNTTSGGTWSSSNTSVATIGATNGVVSAISTGTTSITYTISGTCGSANAVAVLTVNLSPSTGTITGSGSVCTGSALTLSDAVSGGSWSSADPSVATIDAISGILAGVAPGAVTISYTVTNGCGTAIATTVVTVNAGPVAGTISGGTNICPSSTTTLSSTAVGGVWSSGNASVAAVGSADGIVSGVSNGVATISYAVTNSCGTAVASVVVTVSASPSAGAITGASSACAGSLITLSNSVSGGTWSSSTTAVATINSAGVLNAIAAGTTIISYTVTTSCGTAVATSVFTVNALPDAGSITGLSSVNVGAAITLSDVAAGGVWSMSNGNATISAGGVVTGVALGNDTAYYTVINGCGTDIASKVIVVGYTVDPITGTLTVCLGSSTALSDATSGGVWSSSAPAIASVTSTGLVTGVATGTAVISYTSMGVSATSVVTVLAAPSAITGTMIMCEGTVTTLHNSFSGTWFSDNVSVATVGSTTGYVNGLASGTAGITFTMASGCTASVIVTINGLPAAITGSATACIGNTTTLSDADAGGTWSSSNVGVAAVGSATGIVTGVNTGTARITYTLPTSCRTITVATVNAPPAAITGTMTMCEGATTVLSTTTTGGAWSSSNASIASVSATGIVTGVTAGTADITYTTGAGCTRSATVTVNVTPGSTTGVHSVCIGLTTTLSNATPGGTWASSTGSVATINTSGIVTGITAGTSRITYAVGSCKTTSVVSVNALPGTIYGTKKACVGLTTTLSATPAGGTWSASNIFIASIGATSGIVTGNSAGTTDVTYTSSVGCYRTTTVTINPVPATISGTTLVCVGSSTVLSSSTSGGLSWTTSASAIASVSSTGLVTGNATGIASITYTLGTGCYTSTDVTVTPLPSTITGTKIVCVGAVTSLGDAISGGTWSSGSVANATVDPSTGVVTGVAYGTSSITYSISTGCFQKTTVSVNPQPGAISGYSITCIGTSTELSSTYGGTWISGNTGIATVGASTGIVTGVSGGTVDITYALTSTGCYRTQTVTVNAALPASTGTFSVCPGLTTTLSNSIAGGTWVSPNSAIATVGSLSGIVTGVGAGTIGISYTFGTGCRAVTIVTVKPLPATISGPASMCNTMTANLTDVTPGGTWSSSDLSVATVGITNGVVYGVAGGTANITYTAPNTCYASTVMTVVPCIRPGNPNATPELLNARLYPNPTSGVFTIETGHSGTLVLFTLDGKPLESYDVKAGITELTIPHGLAAGVYMCRFNADDGETLMVRLIYEP